MNKKQHTTEGTPLYDKQTGQAFFYVNERDAGLLAQNPDRFRLATVWEQRMIVLPPVMNNYNPQLLTHEWIEFDPTRGYQKQMQDIRLKNGDEVMKCWPNAMVWVTMLPGKYYNTDIPVQDATHVRLTHDENWNR